jgi:hypothetical protein
MTFEPLQEISNQLKIINNKISDFKNILKSDNLTEEIRLETESLLRKETQAREDLISKMSKIAKDLD